MNGPVVIAVILIASCVAGMVGVAIQDYREWSREYDARQERRRQRDKTAHPASFGKGHLRVVVGDE